MLAHLGVTEAEAIEHVRMIRARSNVLISSSRLDVYLTDMLARQRAHVRQLKWQRETEAQIRAERERLERAYRRTSWWSRILYSLACIPHDEFEEQVRLLRSPPPPPEAAKLSTP